MLDEGLAREIINRVQKLRKKAKLQPADDITVYYTVGAGGRLAAVAHDYAQFIFQTIKQPMVNGKAPAGSEVIIQEGTKVRWDAEM